jgi:hypothetical protein
MHGFIAPMLLLFYRWAPPDEANGAKGSVDHQTGIGWNLQFISKPGRYLVTEITPGTCQTGDFTLLGLG